VIDWHYKTYENTRLSCRVLGTPIDWLIDWLIEQGLTYLHQHSIGYLEDSFTGQKTQPTVSKYWRKNATKVMKTQKKQTTENTVTQ